MEIPRFGKLSDWPQDGKTGEGRLSPCPVFSSLTQDKIAGKMNSLENCGNTSAQQMNVMGRWK